LRNDPKVIEHLAREELGLVRDDELIVYFAPPENKRKETRSNRSARPPRHGPSVCHLVPSSYRRWLAIYGQIMHDPSAATDRWSGLYIALCPRLRPVAAQATPIARSPSLGDNPIATAHESIYISAKTALPGAAVREVSPWTKSSFTGKC